MTDVQSTILYTTHSAQMGNAAAKTDAAGNLFLAWTELEAHSNNTVVLVQKRAPNGALLGQWRVLPPSNRKFDSASLAPVGNDLWVVGTDHEISSAEGRANDFTLGVIQGVFAPTPEPGDAPYDSRVLGGSEPAPTDPVDYAQIQHIVNSEITALVGLFGSHGLRTGLQEKGEDSLVAVMTRAHMGDPTDPRVAAFQAAFSDTLYQSPGLYQRLKETMFLVLRENRVLEAVDHILGPAAPTPKEEPHP